MELNPFTRKTTTWYDNKKPRREGGGGLRAVQIMSTENEIFVAMNSLTALHNAQTSKTKTETRVLFYTSHLRR